MSIGYACLTIGEENTGLTICQLKNASPQKLRDMIANNLTSLETMLEYNSKNRIKLFRISSDLIPFGSHPVNQICWWEEFKPRLTEIGRKLRAEGIRVSMHPGQYTVLNSPVQEVVDRAVLDLVYHARVLDSLQTEESSKIILHIGGSYGDKKAAADRFIREYQLLPEEVRRRLILENDERNYTIAEVLYIAEAIGCPVVFDNLHHRINPSREFREEVEWIERCQATWREKDGPQKIHYSQQKEGSNPGSHSDTIATAAFLEFFERLPVSIPDIMLEVKDKNLSAVKCIHLIEHAKAASLEEEWARYKYLILSRSAKAYQSIRELLKNKTSEAALEFYQIIEAALALPEDTGAQVNAAQHMWGYISRASGEKELKRFERLLTAYTNGGSIAPLKNFLYRCAKERSLTYLMKSLYFFL